MKLTRLTSLVLLIALTLPISAFAATFSNARTLVVSESPTDNVYLSGTDITVAAELPADVLAAGGTLTIAAPVAGDAMLAAGTVTIERPITGDVRAVGAQITILAPVTGDLMLAGGTITASTSAQEVRAIGGTIRITGSGGKAVVYGADVYLSGAFEGDVEVIASDRLTLEEGTVIKGSLHYDAPQQAGIPSSATIVGGVTYTGASSYLPTIEEAQTFAIAGAGVLLIVRLIALLIAGALLAGLFPVFSQMVVDKTLTRSPERFALLALLGFALVVAAPVLIFILIVSFVGMAVAFILLAAYLLLLMLGYLYAGIIAGSALARGVLKRKLVTWKIALLGMLVLCLVGAVPVMGAIVVFVLFLASVGCISTIAYRTAFPRMAAEDDLVRP